MNKKIDDNYISLEDAALYLNIKSGTLRKWIKKKPDMPAHQIGKLWKFKRVELDEWINSGKSAMSDEQKCDK
jgi:DNA binding domain protein, excisionase family